ncbi:MAG: YraN family protein [Pseudomonadota bacterium]
MSSTRDIGSHLENQSQLFLESQGLTFIARNFYCKMGEIDLIMRDQDCLVFVEVRYRSDHRFGSGLESVRGSKIRKLVKTAQFYLQKHQLFDRVSCRFDVVAVSSGDDRPLDFNWIKNAFSADGMV